MWTDWALDLFSGLGGASEAFMLHPQWDVVRIEYNPLLKDVPNTIIQDVLAWREWLPPLIESMGRPPTLVWASPECKYFSFAYNSPRSRAARAGEDYTPPTDQVEAIAAIIKWLKETYAMPKFWIVENVNGSVEFFEPHIGPLKRKIGGVFLYGEFPFLSLPENFEHSKFENDVSSNNPLRYNIRSLIPMEISQAVLDAVHTQSTLNDFV